MLLTASIPTAERLFENFDQPLKSGRSLPIE
jgi:hypothetical protein